jgi:hypothetical protein
MDRSVRHDDRGFIVLEQRGQRADRRLVAGDDGDGAGKSGGAQVFRQLSRVPLRMPSDVAMVYSGWTRRSFICPAPLPMRLLRLAWIASTFAITPM